METNPMTAVSCAALLFDCDGVLVDSEASVTSAWTRWARELGLDPDAVMATVHGRRAVDTVALHVEQARRAEAVAMIDAFELAEVGATTAIPGAAELLASLPPDRWATVTSGKRDLATARLRAAGLPVPRALVTAGDVASGKPHPEGYLAGARLLGVDASRCAVFEDVPVGVRAGRSAGAGVVVGVGGRAFGGDRPDVVVPDLRAVRWTGEGLELAAGIG
ncbi:HAD-IA family hydrolase [Actinosynnema mirum]|nr:HAD-IA family hydrolase [Actinosynnema mirum]